MQRWLLIASFFLASLLMPSAVQAQRLDDFSDNGKIDFDAVVKALQPYGSWIKMDADTYAFEPNIQEIPFSNGRWLYTDFGWFWKGARPYSWATDHYGSWKKNDKGTWLWIPRPAWEAAPIEFRDSGDYIGWRSAALNDEGDYIESQTDRYAHPEEWVFVTKKQFANPLSASLIPAAEKLTDLLDNSSISHHSYYTYRSIERTGPHPADLAPFCTDGGMLAPLTLQDRLEMQRSAVSGPAATPSPAPNLPIGAAAPSPSAVQPLKPTKVNGVTKLIPSSIVDKNPVPSNKPGTEFAFTDPAASDLRAPEIHDARRVNYWIVMSATSPDLFPAPGSKPNALFIYKPDFYQDADGIQHRIQFVLHPDTKSNTADRIQAAITARILKDKAGITDEQTHPAPHGKPPRSPVPATAIP